MKNFKECKEIFNKFSTGKMTQEDFDNWSKEHCEHCILFIKKDHCVFGGKKKKEKEVVS